jgi:hypothetical protein
MAEKRFKVNQSEQFEPYSESVAEETSINFSK